MKPVVVLLSGGMDSATTLAICLENRYEVHSLTINYGQTHAKEVEAAKALLNHYEIPTARRGYVTLPLKDALGKASILNAEGKMNDNISSAPEGSQIATSWIPARNAILLSLAAGYAYVHNIPTIATGVNAIDWSGYPDCTPKFISALQKALQLGLASEEFDIFAPINHFTKKQIVQAGEALRVPWNLTWSCYKGGDRPCEECGACKVRAIGFNKAGVTDPLLTWKEERTNAEEDEGTRGDGSPQETGGESQPKTNPPNSGGQTDQTG